MPLSPFMQSSQDRPGRLRPDRRSGFTVMEVFMVVILLTAVMALVVVNFFPFENALSERPARDQMRLAVAEAHRLARAEKSKVLLRYDEEAESLILLNEMGEERERFTFPEGTEASVTFYRILPEEEMRDEPDFEPEDESVSVLAFESYGVVSPFQVELETDNNAVTFRFDPFSGVSWEESELL